MALLVRATTPLLGLLALMTLISGVMFALAGHDLAGLVVGVVTLLIVLDAVVFGVLAWAAATPGPTWRPVALVLIALNLVAIVLDQVGVFDVIVILVMVVTALAVLATPRAQRFEE